jgi:hypothetical protein
LSYQAKTLADTINTNWALTGRVAKAGSASAGEYPVYIRGFTKSHIQEISERKVVEVRKITALQNVETHPKFQTVTDTYEITCYYELSDVDSSLWDTAEADIEDMCEEVIRITNTVYNPSSGTGDFARTNQQWLNRDDLPRSGDPILRRVLILTLTHLQSTDDTVFHGFENGILALDTSATTADSKPGSDYTYTEAYDVSISFGYDVVPEYVRGGTAAAGVPEYFHAGFSGEFSCSMYAKKADITSSTIEAIDNIYKLQSDGEHAEITFLHSMDNTEGTPVTFSESIPLLVTRVEKTFEDNTMVEFSLSAVVTAPTTYTVA